MKTPIFVGKVSLGFFALFLGLGCSTSQTTQQQRQLEAKGSPPVVTNPRVEPKQVNLSEDLSSGRPVDILADVKTFDSPVDQVKMRLNFAPSTDQNVRFFKRPVEVELHRQVGTTWRARLSPSELRALAINGETITYLGQIYAKNDRGQITVSGQPVEFTIQAPPVSQGRG